MRAFVVAAPAPVVTYEQAVARLKLGGGDAERADVEDMIAGATAHLDGPDGWLGRAIGVQTIEARLDRFEHEIALPYRPIKAITAVAYVDPDGTTQTLDADAYELAGRVVSPAFGSTWPGVRHSREAVRITYTAGYDVVPAAIRTAILLMVGDLYRFRETASVGVTVGAVIPMSTTVESLLSPFRVFQ